MYNLLIKAKTAGQLFSEQLFIPISNKEGEKNGKQ